MLKKGNLKIRLSYVIAIALVFTSVISQGAMTEYASANVLKSMMMQTIDNNANVFKTATSTAVTSTPSVTASVPSVTNAPVNVSTTAPAATITAVTGTKSLKLKKTSVIIARGKSVSIGYTVTKTEAVSEAAVVTVKSTNEKTVKATVNEQSKKIKISVPSSAKAGTSAVVKVTSGTKTVKIKVTVQNKVRKLKTKITAATMNKGKTGTASISLVAVNNSKPTTDKAKVISNKTAKAVKLTYKKGEIIVKIKGLRNGYTHLTLKINGKKSVINVIVQ